jgi:hypothetical protein
MVESDNTPRRSLWPENEVEACPDGFLRIKNWNSKSNMEEEKQPLLLKSTRRLLCGIYPKLALDEIILRPGFKQEPDRVVETATEAAKNNDVVDDDDDQALADAMSQLSLDSNEDDAVPETTNNENNTIPAAKYQSYQELVRIENIGTWISLALRDIQMFRHRQEGGGSSRPPRQQRRANMKVRALEMQQQRLMQKMRSESNASSNDTDDKNGEEEEDGHDIKQELDDEEDEGDGDESQTLRMVRTLNSIRALYPHLLPMLNHPRRNDRNLVIRKTSYKAKKKGAMCWLIGTVAFDTSTAKATQTAHSDAKTILEGFIDVLLAEQIVNDVKGSPDFWTTSWLTELEARCNPAIYNPIELLSTKLNKSHIEVISMTRNLDQGHHGHPGGASPEMDQKYHKAVSKAVSKLQQRLSNILTSRFHGARLSIYGSCLSNLSLGKGSDVDLSLWIPEADALKKGFNDGSVGAEEYQRKMTTLVFQAKRKLEYKDSEFRNMFAITKARIPVITGTFIYANNPYTEDGSIE